jgi:hypothetical protein
MSLGGSRMTEVSAQGAELHDSIPAEDAGKGRGSRIMREGHGQAKDCCSLDGPQGVWGTECFGTPQTSCMRGAYQPTR